MFDISTNSGDIEVYSLSFRVWYGKDANTTSVIDVYTVKGGYVDKAEDSSEWKKIASTTIVSQAWSKVRIEFDEVVNIDNSGDKQAFYIVSSNGAIVAGNYDTKPIASDEHISFLSAVCFPDEEEDLTKGLNERSFVKQLKELKEHDEKEAARRVSLKDSSRSLEKACGLAFLLHM